MSELETVHIGDRPVGTDNPVFIIAEAGVNHYGSLRKALALVDGAKEAGADGVKFQTWDVDDLYVPDGMSGKPLRENSRERRLSYEEFEEVCEYCEEVGISFLSTPDERKSADFLDSLGVPAFKIGSGDLTNLPLLEHVAEKGKPMIVSTGMATEKMIDNALKTIRAAGLEEVIVLHCVSNYPADLDELNLSYLPILRDRTQAHVGLSDHTERTLPAVIATSLGARVIEKHFTVDKEWPGPDNRFSYDVNEFNELIEAVMETETALGEPKKEILDSEKEAQEFARKRIVASREIDAGERIEAADLAYKRPSGGLPPSAFREVIGKRTTERIPKNESITHESLEQDCD